MALLKTENISVSYDGTKIIEDINIELNDGELVCLLGVSGSGKSTLFNIISGLLTPDSGHVLFKGEDIGRPGHITDEIRIAPDDVRHTDLLLSEHFLEYKKRIIKAIGDTC